MSDRHTTGSPGSGVGCGRRSRWSIALTFIGSDRLVWFDAALVGYLFGSIFAVFGVVYRYAVWLRRPPTAMLNRRGWDAFRPAQGAQRWPRCRRWSPRTCSPRGSSAAGRGPGGWPTSWCSGAASSPRSSRSRSTLGLLHFESVGQQADRYQVYVSRVGTLQLRRRQRRRLGHLPRARHRRGAGARRRVHLPAPPAARPGALAVERSGDFLALAGLFAVSVTGLFLTVSSMWLEGRFYSALNTIHALTVILGLMYIPFGKLFHIFQRPGQPRRRLLQAGRTPTAPPAACRRCGEPFASAQQIADLKDGAAAGRLRLRASTAAATTRTPARAAGARQVTLAQSARVGGFG